LTWTLETVAKHVAERQGYEAGADSDGEGWDPARGRI